MEGVWCSLEEWDFGIFVGVKYCGDCNQVRAVLRGVVKIYSTLRPFAAVFKDGTLVFWGHKYDVGDCNKVKAPLR